MPSVFGCWTIPCCGIPARSGPHDAGDGRDLDLSRVSVKDANDEYRPHQLRVVSGPVPGALPMWSLRDDEVAMPGWKATSPGGDAR
jgi:hypothetical protein